MSHCRTWQKRRPERPERHTRTTEGVGTASSRSHPFRRDVCSAMCSNYYRP
ncbi:hypothetical protein ACFPRL_34175 [Pseudoclavibacter helvolus]